MERGSKGLVCDILSLYLTPLNHFPEPLVGHERGEGECKEEV